MKKFLGLTATAALSLAIAAPAMAQGTVVINPGGSRGASDTAQQPTQFLGVESAQVLRDGLGYVSLGGGALPGATFNYMRGMGSGGELAVGVAALANLGAATSFNAALGLGWKQQVMSTGAMGVAVNGMVGATGIGGTLAVPAMASVPVTFGVGQGAFTVEPQISLANLTAGTAGATAGANLGYRQPIAANWQFLGAISPNVGLGGGAFTLPVGVGARFSPTATSHLDFTVGQLTATPAFGGGLGLVGVTGYIGF